MKAMLGSSLRGEADTSMGTNGKKGAKSLWGSGLSLCLLQANICKQQVTMPMDPEPWFWGCFSRVLAHTCQTSPFVVLWG